MRFAALALLVGIGLSVPARSAEPEAEPYIFDVLPLQPYKGNFARLVTAETVPAWVKSISTQGEGTAAPMRSVDVGGVPYRLDRVCKVHDCANNTLDVLWAPRGARVWAALVEGGHKPVLLGNPKPPQAKALEDALAAASAPAAASLAAPAAPVVPAAPRPATSGSGDASTVPAAARAPAPASPVAAAAPQTPTTSRTADPEPYIFDVLPSQPYKGNFARLVKAKGLPGWVHAISAQGTGTAGPAKAVEVAGAPYRLDRVCKVGASCTTDRIDVLWAPRGARVWGALVENGGAPALLGDPKDPQAGVLKAASDGTASPAPADMSTVLPSAAISAPPAAAPTVSEPAGMGPAAGIAPAPTDIFDVLASQPYKGSFARLLKAKGLPGWVKAIAVQGIGVAGPPRTVDVGGMPYRLDRVCAVPACAGHTLDVLWAPGGGRAWAALTDGGKWAMMLGHPEGAQKEALAAAARR